VPDVLLRCYWAVVPINGFEKSVSPSDLLTHLGEATGSTITDRTGRFALKIGLAQQNTRLRTHLCVAVFAPDDVQDLDRPLARSAADSLLFLSQPSSAESGAHKSMLIRLLQAQVDRAGLRLCEPRVNPCEDSLDEYLQRRKCAEEDRRSRVIEHRERVLKNRARAKELVGKLHALPKYLFAGESRDANYIIQGKSDLAKRLPDLQNTVIKKGLEKMQQRRKGFAIRLSDQALERLAAATREKEAAKKDIAEGNDIEHERQHREGSISVETANRREKNEEFDPQTLAAFVREAIGVDGLVRRQVPPSRATLKRLWRKVNRAHATDELGGETDGD
jgi:hypothetical protein